MLILGYSLSISYGTMDSSMLIVELCNTIFAVARTSRMHHTNIMTASLNESARWQIIEPSMRHPCAIHAASMRHAPMIDCGTCWTGHLEGRPRAFRNKIQRRSKMYGALDFSDDFCGLCFGLLRVVKGHYMVDFPSWLVGWLVRRHDGWYHLKTLRSNGT